MRISALFRGIPRRTGEITLAMEGKYWSGPPATASSPQGYWAAASSLPLSRSRALMAS